MTYPWEKPKIDFERYIAFMDCYIRVSVTINGIVAGYFSVVDDGTNLNTETVMPDGVPLVFKKEGHPRTTDPIITLTELVDYVLTHYKR
jgi:hypothetical protein